MLQLVAYQCLRTLLGSVYFLVTALGECSFLFWARVGAQLYCHLGTTEVVHMHPGSCGELMNNRSIQPETHYTSGLAGILTTMNEKKNWKSNTTFQY